MLVAAAFGSVCVFNTRDTLEQSLSSFFVKGPLECCGAFIGIRCTIQNAYTLEIVDVSPSGSKSNGFDGFEAGNLFKTLTGGRKGQPNGLCRRRKEYICFFLRESSIELDRFQFLVTLTTKFGAQKPIISESPFQLVYLTGVKCLKFWSPCQGFGESGTDRLKKGSMYHEGSIMLCCKLK